MKPIERARRKVIFSEGKAVGDGDAGREEDAERGGLMEDVICQRGVI